MRVIVSELGRNKWQVVIAADDGSPLASEVGLIADRGERARIKEALLDAVPGLCPDALEEELLKAACRPPRPEVSASPEPAKDDSSPEELAAAQEVLRSGDLVDQLLVDFDAVGVAGEEELALAIYAVGTSRLLRKPLHVIVRGDSASGKSFIVNTIAKLFPPESIKFATHLTPKALYRMPDLRHRFLVLGERSRSDGPQIEDSTKALREFRSEGRISLSSVQDGKLVEFRVEGPAATIETTTKEDLFNEDANRCLLLTSNESSEQTAKITARQAAAYEGAVQSASEAVIRRHWAMQRLLAAPVAGVVIPFAGLLQQRIPKERVETRRAFPMLMAVIEASALLHRFQREVDAEGRIIATRADYAFAKRVVGAVVSAAISHSPTEAHQRFFETVRLQGYAEGDFLTAPDLGVKIGRDSRRINECFRALRRFGVFEQVTEATGAKAAVWKMLRDVLPDRVNALPEVDEIP